MSSEKFYDNGVPPEDLNKKKSVEIVIENRRLSNATERMSNVTEKETQHNQYAWRSTIENTFLTLICINSIMMGIGTFDFVTEDESLSYIFYLSDLVFLSLFSVELLITLFYWKENPFKDLWVMFDFLIIIISWVLTIIDIVTPMESSGIQVVRSLRIFRILVRIESWRAFLGAVARSLPRLGCLAIFALIIMFIFAVFFTEQYRDMYANGETEEDYFSRLDTTFFTLFQLLTYDNWINVLRDVMTTHPRAWIPFLIYITFTSIIIVNLAIAMICESIFEVLQEEEDSDKLERYKQNMERLTFIKSKCSELQEQLDLLGYNQDLNALENDNEKSIDNQHIEDRKKSGTSQTMSLFRDDATIDEPEVFRLAEFRRLCGYIVNHWIVQNFVIFVIFVNSVLLALETFEFILNNPSAKSALHTANTIFLIFYTVENLMQLIYHGRDMFRDGWLTFDFILIVFSWSSSLTPAFRIFRVLRIIHVIPKFEAMTTITGTLYAAIPNISATLGVLTCLFYVFGVMTTTLFKEVPVGEDVENGLSVDFFGRLDKTMLTLFQLMTMEDWATPARELMVHIWWAHYLLTSFLTLTGLLMINAIVALICEAHNEYTSSKNDDETDMAETMIDEEILQLLTMHANILEILEGSKPNCDDGLL